MPSLLATLGSPGNSILSRLDGAVSLRGSASSTLGDTESGEEDSGAPSSMGVSRLGAGVKAADVEGAVDTAEADVEVGDREVLVERHEMDMKSGEVSMDFVLEWGAV